MPAVEVGRLCVKLAGRDAGKECLIVDILDENFVTIEGNTRRRKCNIRHLEFLPKVAKIKAKASHEEVAKALTSLGFKVTQMKTTGKKLFKKEQAKQIVKKETPKPNKAKALLGLAEQSSVRQTLKEKVVAKVKKSDKPVAKAKTKKKVTAKKPTKKK